MRIKKTLKQIYSKYKTYEASPLMLYLDLKSSYHNLKYRVLNFLDPPPKQHKKELTDDYFERIDPKYGLRFYERQVNVNYMVDPDYALRFVDELYKDEKTNKIMKEFFFTVSKIKKTNEENYEKYLLRKKIFENN